jgi:hypothetical protein
LDKFTGSSGWVQKTYSLDDWAGESIYIRFRYTTDSYVLEEGFYVDDIYPVATWSSVTTLGSSIAGTSYDITGRPDGDYYYRVRGGNPEHGFGEFCGVQLTQVGPFVCRGDTDCNGEISFADINGFVTAVTQQVYCDGTGDNADIDESGSVDFGDINPFVELVTTNPLPIPCP